MDKSELIALVTATGTKMIEATRAFVAKAETALNARVDEKFKALRGTIDELVAKAVAAIPPAEPGRDAAELEILPSIDERKSYRRGTWASHNNGLIRAARNTEPVKDGLLEKAGWVVMVEGVAGVVVTQGEDKRTLEVAAMLTSGTKVVTGFSMPWGGSTSDAELREMIAAEVQKAFATLPKPLADHEASALIRQSVDAAVAKLPKAKDAPPVDEAAIVAKAIAKIPAPVPGKNADPEMVRVVVAAQLPALVEKVQNMLAERVEQARAGLPRLVTEEVRQAVEVIPRPKDGKDADPVETRRIVDHQVAAAVEAIQKPKDGKDVDPEFVRKTVEDALGRAVAAWPKPRDGKDADPELIARMVADAVAELPPAQDGKDADPQVILRMVREAVAALPVPKDGKDADPEAILRAVREAVAAIPKPADGKSVTVEQLAPMVQAEARKAAVDPTAIRVMVQEAVAALPKPKDGMSVSLEQVQRMVEETTMRAVKAIRAPKDGEPGKDAAELEILPSIDEKKSYRRGTWASYNGGLIRAVRNTDPVTNGLHGSGWLVITEGLACPPVFTQGDDPREITCAAMLTSGAKAETTFRLPVLIYREVWREGVYERGDVVTWAGSAWHSQRDRNSDKPGTSDAWKLMVKTGRDGKDATPPQPREPTQVRVR